MKKLYYLTLLLLSLFSVSNNCVASCLDILNCVRPRQTVPIYTNHCSVPSVVVATKDMSKETSAKIIIFGLIGCWVVLMIGCCVHGHQQAKKEIRSYEWIPNKLPKRRMVRNYVGMTLKPASGIKRKSIKRKK